ncbi:cell envelope biogenesis protein TolA [Sphingomonas adhaesiva]|uniref:cell envelope biogenesis protein TolA n=1 Tax=Sphingomonas adhaesiva TaxID=28212 RepID=UPI002FF86D12
MERAEKIGLAGAVAGHVVLFGLLSVGFLDTPDPLKLKPTPVEVSLVKDVALEAAAPATTEQASQAIAPDVGEPEEAPPPTPEEAPAPEPAPKPAPAPEPKPAPAPPKPVPPKPAPAKPAPEPAPAPKPAPQARPKPATPAAEKAPAKPAPAKQQIASSTSKAAAKPAASKGNGKTQAATATRPRGSRLGDDFLKGLTAEPSKARDSDAPPAAAKIDGKALAAIVQAIARQIQPCADRQVDPGPGANQIVTTLNLRLNRDGTLSATPTVVRQAGVDDDNRRYARRVVDLGVAAFKGCSPLKLPAEYYATANGGWSNINYNWKLR